MNNLVSKWANRQTAVSGWLQLLLAIVVPVIMYSCEADNKGKITDNNMKSTNTNNIDNLKDAHSYSKPLEAKVNHMSIDLTIDMAAKKLRGKVTLTFKQTGDAKMLHLDTRDLEILAVTDANHNELKFTQSPETKALGSDLAITLASSKDTVVNVIYTTSETAEALQWLTPQQTAGKKHPFLFTQGEAILTRSWLPLQDSPGIKITYDAKITTPLGLMAVMSAINPVTKSADGIYNFSQKQPIAPYLIALAVGDIAFAKTSTRTGVYAEPSALPKAVAEFEDTEKMVLAAEKLYGVYAWGRYDVIVLPPSFPFGGMENPRLTFATPTILAGDKSLTSLVAHELAHSWSGNLVTNATWNDFWLNEGFTVYFERRIMESLKGKDYAQMLETLGYQDLLETLNGFKDQPNASLLKLNLTGQNPDDGMNDIAYEKGYFLLRTIENEVGRDNFDAFLKDYFSTNAFKSITTEAFIAQLDAKLLSKHEGSEAKIMLNDWVYKPGLPANLPTPHSVLFDNVDKQLKAYNESQKASTLKTKDWSTHEWLHFLRNIEKGNSSAKMADLDATFKFSKGKNAEIDFQWYLLAIKTKYQPAMAPMERFLVNTGRRKFLTPLYSAMLQDPTMAPLATTIYKKARPNYHFVATNTLDKLMPKV